MEKNVFFVIKELDKKVKQQIRNDANRVGICVAYFPILRILSLNSEPVNQKDICNMIRLSAPTISLTIRDMERDGLINRTKNPVDSRMVFISLTEEGKKTTKTIREIFNKNNDLMVNALTKEELNSFLSIIEKLNKVYE